MAETVIIGLGLRNTVVQTHFGGEESGKIPTGLGSRVSNVDFLWIVLVALSL